MDSFGNKIKPEQLKDLLNKNDPIILEIGCNDGDDTEIFARTFPGGVIHCFEPDPRPIRQFKQRLMGDVSISLHEVAVADKPGMAKFWQSSGTTRGAHKQDWDLSGSLNKPTGHLKQSPWCKFRTSINVPVITLDDFYKNHLEGKTIDLVWMDVQGGEGNVISGGRRAIHSTRFIYSEFGHWKEPLYDGQMNLEQTISFLGANWEALATFEGYNVLLKNKRLAG